MIFSVYLLACFWNIKEIGGYTYAPFAIQTCFHMIGKLFTLNVTILMTYNAQAITEETLPQTLRLTNSPTLCLSRVVSVASTDYSTGLAMLSLAVHRFILVARPYDVKQILTEFYFKVVFFVVAFIATALVIASAARTMIEFQPNQQFPDCQGPSFYGNRRTRAMADGLFFSLYRLRSV